MKHISLRKPSKARPSAARWRLLAATVFTIIPATGLPLYLDHLYSVRPIVTDVRAGFVNPHFHNGVAYYFAHGDETVIRALAFWLLAAVILLMFAAGQIMRRRLKQWLRPPEVTPPAATDDTPANPA